MALAPFQHVRLQRLDEDSDEESDQLPDIVVDEGVFPSSLFGYQFALDTAQESNFQQLLRNFDRLELYCDAPYESLYESSTSCSIDVSLEEAFSFPQKISKRLPTGTNNNRQITVANLKNMWCRLVAHYFEWVAGVPELRLMEAQQRIHLVTRQLCKIICLIVSFWTYQQDSDGIIFGSGICFNPREAQDEVVKNYVTALADVIQNRMVSTFRRIRITREEYLLLKLVVMFDPLDMRFPAADGLIMENALSKYRTALVSHIQSSNPDLNHEAVMERILALFSVIPYLELLSQLDNMHLAAFILQNNGNMQGRLTNEIHVHAIPID